MDIYNNILKCAKTQERPISQIEKEAGLQNGAISKWKKCSPTLKNILAVAEVLGVDIKELVE